MFVSTQSLTHLGGGSFTAEASDLGIRASDPLPKRLTLTNPRTGGSRTYSLRKRVQNMPEAEDLCWTYESSIGGTVTLWND